MKNILSSFYKIGFIFVLFSVSCASRNLYSKKRTISEDATPLKREYVYLSRDLIEDAGEEPVEYQTPVTNESSLYIPTQKQGLRAVEKRTFIPRWNFNVKNGISSGLLLSNVDGQESLFFGAFDGYVYALDAEFGTTLWKFDVKSVVYAKPVLSENKVLIHTADNVLYCLDAKTGKWLWHYKRTINQSTSIHGNSSPLVDSGLVYLGTTDGYILALKLRDGNIGWEQKIRRGIKFTDVDATPITDGTWIYVTSYDGELYAIDKVQGKVLWHIEVGGARKVLLIDKTLYVPSTFGKVYSIQKETGRIQWSFELDEGTPTSIVSNNNLLAFGSSQQYLYVVNKTDGSLVYRNNIGLRSGFFSDPWTDAERIYFYSNFGNLYVYKWTSLKNKKTIL